MARRDGYDDYELPRRRQRNVTQATNVVVNVGGGRSFFTWHVVHLVLTFCTCGLWLPVWAVHFLVWVSCK